MSIPDLPEGWAVVRKGEWYNLIRLEANVLAQEASGRWRYEPSLEECKMQIRALEELGE